MEIILFNYELVTSSIETVNIAVTLPPVEGEEPVPVSPVLATRFTIELNLQVSTAPEGKGIFRDTMYLFFLESEELTATQIREKITDIAWLESQINNYINSTYNV